MAPTDAHGIRKRVRLERCDTGVQHERRHVDALGDEPHERDMGVQRTHVPGHPAAGRFQTVVTPARVFDGVRPA
jgi:hypothetical protein